MADIDAVSHRVHIRDSGLSAVAVFHTHSRKLDFWPHVHLAMPAAALDADKGLWRSLRKSEKGDTKALDGRRGGKDIVRGS